jgi:hypothetical protein
MRYALGILHQIEHFKNLPDHLSQLVLSLLIPSLINQQDLRRYIYFLVT